jgi:hypothetical protein
MTVIVNVTPAWIRGKSTVSPNDSVEFLPPRILARVRGAAAKCAEILRRITPTNHAKGTHWLAGSSTAHARMI